MLAPGAAFPSNTHVLASLIADECFVYDEEAEDDHDDEQVPSPVHPPSREDSVHWVQLPISWELLSVMKGITSTDGTDWSSLRRLSDDIVVAWAQDAPYVRGNLLSPILPRCSTVKWRGILLKMHHVLLHPAFDSALEEICAAAPSLSDSDPSPSFVLYWGGKGIRPPGRNSWRPQGVQAVHFCLELDVVALCCHAQGNHDHSLEAMVAEQLLGHSPQSSALIEAFFRLHGSCLEHQIMGLRFSEYVEALVSSDSDRVRRAVGHLQDDLLALLPFRFMPSLGKIEQLLVSCLGHTIPSVRGKAVCLLNVLYDETDWQLSVPFLPIVSYVGEEFVVALEVLTPAARALFQEENVVFLVRCPSFKTSSRHDIVTRHTPVITNSTVEVRLGKFRRAGYYDWRFMRLRTDGQYEPLEIDEFLPTELMGRFIVQPDLRDDFFHEVWPDTEGAEWDPTTGLLKRRGDFGSVADALDMYQSSFNVSTLYVMGAMERDTGRGPNYARPDASPLSPTNRSQPTSILGGPPKFKMLVDLARQKGIKVLVDWIGRVSAARHSKKYEGLLVQSLDSGGLNYVHPGTDGKGLTWADCRQLNYRKLKVWELDVSEVLQWARKYGVGGIRLDNAQCMPLILRPDDNELHRVEIDDDGEESPCYSDLEILWGDITLPATDEATSFGYWGSLEAREFPNPYFIKMTRTLWSEYPRFVFIAEAFWGREKELILSGLVPYVSDMITTLTNIFGKVLHLDGTLTKISRKGVSSLYSWFEKRRPELAEGSLMLASSCSHFTPFPSLLYDAGVWAVVDLLFFGLEIPITFSGEQKGHAHLIPLTSVSALPHAREGMAASEELVRLPDVLGHYAHRSMLRRMNPVFRHGKMIPLYARHTGQGWVNRVFAFARYTDLEELAIVAISFDDTPTNFYIDCQRLEPLIPDLFACYEITDVINPHAQKSYKSGGELLHMHDYVALPPFGCLCQKVVCLSGHAAQKKLAEQALHRLQRLIRGTTEQVRTNFLFAVLARALKTFGSFRTAVRYICDLLLPKHEGTLPFCLQGVLFHATRTHSARDEAIALIYLERLTVDEDERLAHIGRRIVESNKVGPVVIVTPELGRFSTVGGLGVMVNDLSQGLAALGAEVHIVSPYYNKNTKGQTGYLEREGVEHRRTIQTTIGNELVDIGVHELVEKGVHLYFLHNYLLFPEPYHGGGPLYQLRSLVAMAKGSLELCCQLHLIPALIITNDWFAGLVAGFGHSGHFGATFENTTFFHIIHNLEEGYNGKIWPPKGEDWHNIHELPYDVVIDQFSGDGAINPSRAALLCSSQWGTVSPTYRDDLMRVSSLSSLLRHHPRPFAFSNGIRLHASRERLSTIAPNHEEAKSLLQKKYFGYSDPSIVVFGFVGRITVQKGVLLVVNSIHDLMEKYKGKVQVIVGGKANYRDPYSAHCAGIMSAVHNAHPRNFWADPNEFFTDGPLLNLGADFGLVPSLFEPAGLVQHEFFAAGTPVICFKTGGLKDTVREFNPLSGQGTGFTFEAHAIGDFLWAVERATMVFNDPTKYEQLRGNAYNAAIDMMQVAWAWWQEFCRLRQRLAAEPDELERARTIGDMEKVEPLDSEIPTPVPDSKNAVRVLAGQRLRIQGFPDTMPESAVATAIETRTHLSAQISLVEGAGGVAIATFASATDSKNAMQALQGAQVAPRHTLWVTFEAHEP